MENKEVYGWIYKITNVLEDKCYIGQTTQNPPEKRFKEHKWIVKNRGQDYIHGAMQDHGVENFTFEIVDIAYNQKELNLLEGVYIAWFNSLVPNGYNLTNIINGKGKMAEETKERLRIIYNKPEHLLIRSNNGKNSRGKSRSNSTSKYCGVSLVKNKYVATIGINNKSKYLGYFFTEEDAAKAYDIAVLQYHGIDSKLNFQELREAYINNEIIINKYKPVKKSNSVIKGVSYHHSRNRWIAKIRGFKEKSFKNREDAEQCVLEWRKLQS